MYESFHIFMQTIYVYDKNNAILMHVFLIRFLHGGTKSHLLRTTSLPIIPIPAQSFYILQILMNSTTGLGYKPQCWLL